MADAHAEDLHVVERQRRLAVAEAQVVDDDVQRPVQFSRLVMVE